MSGTNTKIDIRKQYTTNFTKPPVIDRSAWWGYSINNALPDPAVTPIGNAELLSDNPILAQMRAAVINDDETVNYYLNPANFDLKADGSPSTLTGADGQVMIYKPSYYKRVEEVGDITYVRFSRLALPGYTLIPAYWIGQVLGSIVDNKLCSIHGVMPTTNKNLSEFRTAARLRNGGTNWCQMDYNVWEFLNDAVRMKYLTRDIQNAAVLGAGATNASSGNWSTYNGYNPVVLNGLKKTLDDSPAAFTVSDWPVAPLVSQSACFMGIEHVFGHIWSWMDGLNVQNTTGSVSKAYLCRNPAQYLQDTLTNYSELGQMPASDGYIKKVLKGGMLTQTVGGGSNTYFCDYYYQSAASAGWRGSLVGGNLSFGSFAGLAFSYFYYAASYRLAYIGSRLCLRVA